MDGVARQCADRQLPTRDTMEKTTTEHTEGETTMNDSESIAESFAVCRQSLQPAVSPTRFQSNGAALTTPHRACLATAPVPKTFQLFMKAVQDFDNQVTSDRKAFVFAKNKEVWTWARLSYEVDRLASGLIGLGIQQGDRVALHMADLPEFVVAYLACFQVGAIAAPLNIRLKNAELEPLLQRLSPSLSLHRSIGSL
jgi:hypothetical protein